MIIFFIEKNNGETFYKMDTFWSRSKKWIKSKIYGMGHIKSKDWSILTSYDYVIKTEIDDNLDNIDDVYNLYNNCKLGYREVDDDLLMNHGYLMREDIEESMLGRKRYTHQVIMDGINKPKIVDVIKEQRRDETIEQILN